MAGAPALTPAAPAHSRLYGFLSEHASVAVVLMGLSFVLFGLASLNLLHLVSANVSFLVMNGLDAVRDGGLLQLFSLVALGYFAAFFYVVFKLCEKVLVERLACDRSKGP